MNLTDIIPLTILADNKKDGELNAFTINQMLKYTTKSRSTLMAKIKMWQLQGAIKQGAKDGHAETFYITEKGLKLYNDLKEASGND